MKRFCLIFACVSLACAYCFSGCTQNAALGAAGSSGVASGVQNAVSASCGVFSQPSVTDVNWVLEPSCDFDSVVIIDGTQRTNVEAENTYQGLAFFRKNEQAGVVNQAGDVVIPAEKNVTWCDLCGIVSIEGHEGYTARGICVGNIGHGGTSPFVYETAQQQTVMISYGFISAAAPGNAQILAMVHANGSYGQDEAPDLGNLLTYLGTFRCVDASGTACSDTIYIDFYARPECATRLPEAGMLSGFRSGLLSNGVVAQTPDGMWQFLNADGTPAPLGRFEGALPFQEGIAAVKRDDKWGFINEAGDMLTPFVFEDAASVCNGRAWVRSGGLWGVAQITESVHAPSAGTQQKTMEVAAAEGLRLRAGPGTEYEKLALIPDQTVLTVQELYDGWVKVIYEGVQGWVSQEYLTARP